MICVDCDKPVSDEEMANRRAELWKQYGMIARVIPLCKECREARENARNTADYHIGFTKKG